ncbi:hypothetical protein D0469_07465 [Peribacillus saganii]|uniref:Lipoprotein n=2 Tax=Peribacillus saganii TaxID=2303992 RepID=A0A372LQH5_9BACI|nr:hypothetical protein D0469_07465 [Peribacillus saganii]
MKFKNLLLSIPLSAGLLVAGCAEADPAPEDDNMEEQDNMELEVPEADEENLDKDEPDMTEEPSEEQ